MEGNFYKYQGTGNDFIIFDNRQQPTLQLTIKQIQHLCNRKFGIGADGIILLNNTQAADFEMIYYNADGNIGSMCGNGGRCIVKFANDIGIKKDTYNFLAADGMHQAQIDFDGNVRLKMQSVNQVETHAHYAVLNTGSPHYIKFSTNVQDLDVEELGHKIRYSKEYATDGINVNFVENINPYTIFVRTYERGVEAETLSCGTGVTAAALVSAHNDSGFNQVQVHTTGGKLSVEFNKINNQHFSNIYLCGPATFVFKGTINLQKNDSIF